MVRVLELQEKYGIDQDTMLIYICSVNLTSILSLIGRRQQGNSSGYLQAPVPGSVTAPAPQNAGNNQSTNNLAGMLAGMLGGGTNGQGVNPAALLNMLGSLGGKNGQGLNPALLTSLLGALGGQGKDLSGLLNMMSTLMGTMPKPVVSPGVAAEKPAAPTKEAAAPKNPSLEEKRPVREVPKILKWDHLDNRRRA
ncbi:MAG: hypothetical protein A4E53_03597 [Pelotomaculum sp. PtaB.Bin104]|nr:MAG: hypothetical protein A4E53_03597 [Pelotomaculum sp. PtaB.Bin104]